MIAVAYYLATQRDLVKNRMGKVGRKSKNYRQFFAKRRRFAWGVLATVQFRAPSPRLPSHWERLEAPRRVTLRANIGANDIPATKSPNSAERLAPVPKLDLRPRQRPAKRAARRSD
jgi:hypothetical protein